MAEFEHSIVVHAAPDKVFAFVSDLRNLPKYLPTMHLTIPEGPDRVRVEGESDGRNYAADGYFRVDDADYVMEWSSDGDDAYSGWLEVEELEDNMSEVTVHLSFLPRTGQARLNSEQIKDRDAIMQENLEAALMSIQNIVEGRVEVIQSAAPIK